MMTAMIKHMHSYIRIYKLLHICGNVQIYNCKYILTYTHDSAFMNILTLINCQVTCKGNDAFIIFKSGLSLWMYNDSSIFLWSSMCEVFSILKFVADMG